MTKSEAFPNFLYYKHCMTTDTCKCEVQFAHYDNKQKYEELLRTSIFEPMKNSITT